jgi:formamidopyrimidine-DNA glycosylase
VPELPDVEHMRRVLAAHGAGRVIDRVITTDPGILRNTTPETLDAAARGHRFEDPGRVGKWLIGWTTGPVLLLHFGMTGDLIPAEDRSGRHRHDRTIFELDSGEIRYRNMRKLGGLWLAHDRGEADHLLAGLGPDALSIDRGQFVALFRARRGRVKAVLMNQAVLSGVGNLVADEVLWHARIAPSTLVAGLADEDLGRLHRSLVRILRLWVDRHGRLPGGWLIHARGMDGACPRCGAELERSVVGGRTTYHCPVCQPA